MKKPILFVLLLAIFIHLPSTPCSGLSVSQTPVIKTVRLKQQIRLIVADRRFVYPDPLGWWNKLWGKSGQKIESWFKKFRQWMWKLKTASRKRYDVVFSRTIQYVGLACLILLPFLLVYFLPRMFRKNNRLKQAHSRTGGSLTRPVRLIDEAAIMAARGEYREAIRTLYLAVLEDYKNRSLLPNGRLFSDKENLLLLRRAYGAEHGVYRAFDQIVKIFREKWYGLKDCRPADYENVLRLSETILEKNGKNNAKP